MKRSTLWFLLACLLTACVVCFIFSNSTQGAEVSNSRSGIFSGILRAILDPQYTIAEEVFHHYVRKAAHFTEFALLGASLWLLMRSIQHRFSVFCPGAMLFAALATAVADEFIQSFGDRTSSVRDVLIDFCGAATAFAGLAVLYAICKKKEKKNACEKCGTE